MNLTNKSLVITKILNHNVIQGIDPLDNNEYLVHGKGVGFQKKANDKLSVNPSMQLYVMKDPKLIKNYQSLLSSSDENIVAISEEIIGQLKKKFGNDYSESLHISLLDHLNFSIYRLQNKVDMKHIFLDELKSMYPKEYLFAQEMVEFVNRSLEISLPDAEIGFICMHIHSAYHGDSASNTVLIVQMVSRCISFLENSLRCTLDPDSIERQRLITHLKFAFRRAKSNAAIQNPLADSIKEKLPKTYALAKQLSHIVQNEFLIHLEEGEIAYLALHIEAILLSQKGRSQL